MELSKSGADVLDGIVFKFSKTKPAIEKFFSDGDSRELNNLTKSALVEAMELILKSLKEAKMTNVPEDNKEEINWCFDCSGLVIEEVIDACDYCKTNHKNKNSSCDKDLTKIKCFTCTICKKSRSQAQYAEIFENIKVIAGGFKDLDGNIIRRSRAKKFDKKNEVKCPFLQKGKCKKDKDCDFSHEISDEDGDNFEKERKSKKK